MMVRISRSLAERLRARAAAEPGREICGLLLGPSRPSREGDERIGEIVPADNIAANPSRAFELDPALLFAAHRAARAGGPRLLGHYHSHPSGLARPSRRDAMTPGEPGTLWLILAQGEIAAWRALPGGPIEGAFEPVPLIIDG